jgi:hypothetical protein
VAEDSTPTQPTPDAPATADTPTAAAPDTGANTQQSPQPTDWESRYKASQAELTRKSQALIARERDLEDLRAASTESDEGDEEAPQPGRKPNRQAETIAKYEERLAEAEWTIARSIYDDSTIDAYSSAATLLESAETATDHVAAFEAYHQARLGGATPAAAAPTVGAPPPSAVAPRADSNRSDAPVLPDVEAQLREASEKHDLGLGVKALLAKAGLRG